MSACVNKPTDLYCSVSVCFIYIDLVYGGSVVGMGSPSWETPVMHICLMHVVQMMRMMLGMDIIFFIIICYQLHPALSLQERKKKGETEETEYFKMHRKTRPHTDSRSLIFLTLLVCFGKMYSGSQNDQAEEFLDGGKKYVESHQS